MPVGVDNAVQVPNDYSCIYVHFISTHNVSFCRPRVFSVRDFSSDRLLFFKD